MKVFLALLFAFSAIAAPETSAAKATASSAPPPVITVELERGGRSVSARAYASAAYHAVFTLTPQGLVASYADGGSPVAQPAPGSAPILVVDYIAYRAPITSMDVGSYEFRASILGKNRGVLTGEFATMDSESMSTLLLVRPTQWGDVTFPLLDSAGHALHVRVRVDD